MRLITAILALLLITAMANAQHVIVVNGLPYTAAAPAPWGARVITVQPASTTWSISRPIMLAPRMAVPVASPPGLTTCPGGVCPTR